MKNTRTDSLIRLVSSMVIFGTIGIIRNYIPLSSAALAMLRGFTGAGFLLIVMFVSRKKTNKSALKGNFIYLALSGIFIGINWMLLFEAFNFTSVATATLCYYMAPVFVITVSPFLLKEKITPVKLICIFLSVAGMVFVSGILTSESTGIKGALLALSAAVFYAAVIIINKKISGVDSYSKTVIQLFFAALALVPFEISGGSLKYTGSGTGTLTVFILTAVLGIVHTGVAYMLYFSSMDGLPAQTVSIFSYIDPVTAVILSAVLLHEDTGPGCLIGGILIVGSAVLCELNPKIKISKAKQ